MHWNKDKQQFDMSPRAEAIFCAALLGCPTGYVLLWAIVQLIALVD